MSDNHISFSDGFSFNHTNNIDENSNIFDSQKILLR